MPWGEPSAVTQPRWSRPRNTRRQRSRHSATSPPASFRRRWPTTGCGWLSRPTPCATPVRRESRTAAARTASLASVEAAAYFCSVQVIDDQVKSGGWVGVDIEQLDHSILIHLTSDGDPTPATIQLVEDRVEATDGVLDRRTSDPLADRAAGHVLLLNWDLGA